MSNYIHFRSINTNNCFIVDEHNFALAAMGEVFTSLAKKLGKLEWSNTTHISNRISYGFNVDNVFFVNKTPLRDKSLSDGWEKK